MKLRRWVFLLLVAAGILYTALLWPLGNPHAAVLPAKGLMAIEDVKVYVSPDVAPIEHGSVLVT